MLYNRTGNCVLLVAIFNAAVNQLSDDQLSDDVIPGSNTTLFRIFSGVIIRALSASHWNQTAVGWVDRGGCGQSAFDRKSCNRVRLPLVAAPASPPAAELREVLP
jgi:hypothetical protein